jgi:hypothetical protein
MLLPVMLFHGFQIVFVSFIAARKAKEIRWNFWNFSLKSTINR